MNGQFLKIFEKFFLHRPSGYSNRVSVFALTGRLLSVPAEWALELPQAVRPTGGSLSAPADRGTRTAAGGFALMGRLLSLHRLNGVLELPQAGSPLTGGKFSLNLSGRERRRPPRGRRRTHGGGQKEGTPAVSLPL